MSQSTEQVSIVPKEKKMKGERRGKKGIQMGAICPSGGNSLSSYTCYCCLQMLRLRWEDRKVKP